LVIISSFSSPPSPPHARHTPSRHVPPEWQRTDPTLNPTLNVTRHQGDRYHSSTRAVRCNCQLMEEGAPCVNHVMCGESTCPQVTSSGTCMSCGSWFKLGGHGFNALDIGPPVECVVCTTVGPSVKFPQCMHRACPACFKDIMFWDETRTHLDPRQFGCPPCPNACDNPVRGRQCGCYEYDPVQVAWGQTHPQEYKAWGDAEQRSADAPMGGAYATKACPVCRVVWQRRTRSPPLEGPWASED
jgi:hypothetical protein